MPEEDEWEVCSEKSGYSDDESEFLAGFRDMREMPAFGKQQLTDTPDSSTGEGDVDDTSSMIGTGDGPKQVLPARNKRPGILNVVWFRQRYV